MNTMFKFLTGGLLLVFLSALTVCQEAPALETGLRSLLPEAPGEWRRQGEFLEYAEDELFDYINGGAEIYYEYGFVRVIVQDYRSPGEHTLSLEIYEMEDPESAFGIFSFKRSTGGKNEDVGDQGRLEDYYLNYWKGKYLVTITGFDAEEATVQGLQTVAQAAAERIQERGTLPSLLNLLPQPGRVEAGLKYFEGMLSLYNSQPFAQEDIFNLKEGVRIDYTGGFSLFLFQYSDAEGAGAAMKRSRAFFESSSRYSDYVSLAPHRFRVTDNKERPLVVDAFENYITVVMSMADLNQAQEYLAEIQARIKGL
ncbi:MAG: hypothetical protein GQ544_09620 [Candidatus Aminicenantes bacterium]|nr:hypothetical protein [Candidatus Aminicenantes bacterium]